MSARTKVIADLRTAIDGIERRPALAGPRGAEAAGAARDGVPQAGPGTLNEIFVDGTRDAGAALGFCLMQARGLTTPERPAVIFLQMRAEAQETGLPYGPGLAGFGLDPDALVVVRTDTIVEMLWAMEEAAGCRNVAVAIGDFARHHKALDFTASRRLGMRAAAFGVTLMVMRYGTGREASAAHLRWRIAALPSADAAFDARESGAARYAVTLEKGGRRLGGTGARPGRNFWTLEWSENGFVADTPGKRSGVASSGKPALSGADAAGLADRLSQTA